MNGGGSVSYVSSGWNIEGMGDFDGDGDADILWRNGATGRFDLVDARNHDCDPGHPGQPHPRLGYRRRWRFRWERQE